MSILGNCVSAPESTVSGLGENCLELQPPERAVVRTFDRVFTLKGFFFRNSFPPKSNYNLVKHRVFEAYS